MGCTTSRTIEKNKNSHINNKIISNNIDESPFENKDSPRENEKSPKKSKMKQNKRRKSKIKSQSLSPDKKLSINFPNLNQINNQTPNTPIIINQKKDESKNENSQKEEKEENSNETKEKNTPNKIEINRKLINRKSTFRKSQCNGIVIVDNLKNYLPENISKEEINEMVYNALEGCIVDDITKVIRGKTITKEQADAIANIVFDKVKCDKNDSDNEEEIKKDKFQRRKSRRYSILNQVFVNVGMTDLTTDFLKKTVFKNKNPSEQQIENAMKNLSQGNENVKVLTIELR
jgi:hypothetical protein